MTTDMLRCALRGVAAYRPVVDEPVMRLALGVLDKLSAGDGSGAVEDYARLFYALRSAGSRPSSHSPRLRLPALRRA